VHSPRAVTHRLQSLLELLGVLADGMPIGLVIAGKCSVAGSRIVLETCSTGVSWHQKTGRA